MGFGYAAQLSFPAPRLETPRPRPDPAVAAVASSQRGPSLRRGRRPGGGPGRVSARGLAAQQRRRQPRVLGDSRLQRERARTDVRRRLPVARPAGDGPDRLPVPSQDALQGAGSQRLGLGHRGRRIAARRYQPPAEPHRQLLLLPAGLALAARRPHRGARQRGCHRQPRCRPPRHDLGAGRRVLRSPALHAGRRGLRRHRLRTLRAGAEHVQLDGSYGGSLERFGDVHWNSIGIRLISKPFF